MDEVLFAKAVQYISELFQMDQAEAAKQIEVTVREK